MESNLSNSLKLIDFSIAIMNNDLEQVKEFVDFFNSLDSSVYANGFNLFDIRLKSYNESFEYVLDNLTNYPGVKKLKWEIGISEIVSRYLNNIITDDDISAIINNALEEDIDAFIEYKCSGLIRLANVIHDYDSLIKIRNMINNIIYTDINEDTNNNDANIDENTDNIDTEN